MREFPEQKSFQPITGAPGRKAGLRNMRRIWISFPCMLIDLPADFPLVRLAEVAHGAGWKLVFNRRSWRLEVVE